MANTPDEKLNSALATWISEQGYPLELRVAQHFRRAGWSAGHGYIYEDPDTQDLRELDLVARFLPEGSKRGKVTDGQGPIVLTLAIECKSSRKAKPWGAFGTDGEPFDDFGGIMKVTPDGASRSLLSILDKDLSLPTILPSMRPNHALAQAFNDDSKGSNPAYAGLMSSLKGALAVARHQDARLAEDYPLLMPLVELILPVVVTDDRLFEWAE